MAMDWLGTAMRVGTGLVYLVIGVLVVAMIGAGVYFWKLNKEYAKYKVIIWRRVKDSNGTEVPVFVGIDRGRRMYNKALKRWCLHVKDWNLNFGEEEKRNADENRELDLPVMASDKGYYVVFIEKLGNRKGALGKPFVLKGNVEVLVSEADVAEAMRAYDLNARAFGKKDNQALAFTLYIILAAFILILIIVILNKFELIKTAADSFQKGAVALQGAQSSVVPSAVAG